MGFGLKVLSQSEAEHSAPKVLARLLLHGSIIDQTRTFPAAHLQEMQRPGQVRNPIRILDPKSYIHLSGASGKHPGISRHFQPAAKKLM